jgi:uncharacterized protein (DUF1697 family)
MTYLALLRGINVVGKKSIKMAELVKLFKSLKFKNVRTYIQSGNVIFESSSSNTEILTRTIETAIEKKFGFSVSVIIRTSEELKKIVAKNPLLKEKNIQMDKLHVTFLKDVPAKELVASLEMNEASNEKYVINNREIYLYCPNGYGITKLNNSIFEKKLKIVATTRNWKTTTTLLEVAT